MLTRLAVHYYRPDFTQGQVHLLIEDMLDDLHEFTVGEIENSIRIYRQDAEQRFFPRGAQLRGIILADRKQRREAHQRPRITPEFGDSRPMGWEFLNPQLWKPHWHPDDLNRARDPDRRKRYDAWAARHHSSDAT